MLKRNFLSSRPLTAIVVLVCLVLLPARPAHGWGPGGHMMVAKIAFNRLNPKAKAEVRKLMASPINPSKVTSKSLDFVNASNWADDVKKLKGFEYSGDEHFADFPFSVDDTRVPTNLPGQVNIIKALERYVDVLKTSNSKAKRAEALRFVVHYVGDIHQPLHCSTRVDKGHKKGDGGGNAFLVNVPVGTGKRLREVNLHSYWDGGLDSFPKGRVIEGEPKVFIPPPLKKIPPAALIVVKANPEDNPALHLDNPTDFQGWADESSRLAREFAYDGLDPNGTVDAEYKTKGLDVAQRRVAWAGYRLAALLNSIWPE